MASLLSFIGGTLPVFIWLWFWLKEDKLNPEPKKNIIMSFLAGMITALFVLPIELFLVGKVSFYSVLGIILLASIEEIFKYLSAFFSALRKKVMDEPIDAVIYTITVALGFAAMENTLYLWSTFNNGEIVKGVLMSNMRFIGATVLHTVSSAIIGVAIALSFYKNYWNKAVYLVTGIILSIGLHSSFNLLIIDSDGENIFYIFVFVWISTITLLFILEKIKKIKPEKKDKKTLFTKLTKKK